MTVLERSEVDVESGLLKGETYLPSPHCDERPKGQSIDLIVIHGISLPPSEFGTGAIEAFFCGQLDFSQHEYYKKIEHLRVSSHILISREGGVTQFVPFHQRAWHAGESTFGGHPNCNDYSIGIELEGTDMLPFEPAQYESLAKVIQSLRVAYPGITLDRIVGHSDIAPGRKTDPGPLFDWGKLKGMLA